VCVKFGCKSASGYGHLGKTTRGGGHFYGTPYRFCGVSIPRKFDKSYNPVLRRWPK